MKPNLRKLLVGVTLANLLLLPMWRLLLDGRPYLDPTQPSDYLGMTVATFGLAAAFWCAMWLAGRCGRGADYVGRLIFFVLAAAYVSRAVLLAMRIESAETLPILGANVVVFTSLFILYPSLDRPLATFFVAISPCVLFLWCLAGWQLYRGLSPAETVRGSMAALGSDGPRVLLVVFDELSEDVAFDHRPPGVSLPAFDRMRSESFYSKTAYPTGTGTISAMPALLAGKPVVRVQVKNGFRVRYTQDGEFTSFNTTATMFSEAHSLRLGTAMVGWYHPFCSIVDDIDFCAHSKADFSGIYNRGGVLTKALDEISHIAFLSQTAWALNRREQALRETHGKETEFLFGVTRQVVSKFRSGLVVVHLPVPHPPAIGPTGFYFDNLSIADAELAEIRAMMESAGTWDGTAVIITSDHWWRTSYWAGVGGFTGWTEAEKAYKDADHDPRVPFIVKLPGQHSAEAYEPKMNVLISRSLIRELLTGKIQGTQQLKDWLDLHRNDVPIMAHVLASNPW